MLQGRLYTVGFMVVVACAFTAAVAGLSIVSKPVIARNERLLEQRAYVQVFGLGDVSKLSVDEALSLVDRFIALPAADTEPLVDPETGREFTVLRAYEDESKETLKAIAFNFRGLGFWAPIEGWLALTPDLDRSVGIVITRHSETPGLGGRVQEPIFTKPFESGILVTPPEDSGSTCIIVSSTPPPEGTEKAERHIDAITGATQTCMAMETILDESLRAFRRAWDAGRKPIEDAI